MGASQPPRQYVGRTVSFQAATASTDSSYDQPVEFLWEFGDDELAEGSSVSHIYSTSGEYEVTLTTFNEDGNTATASKNVVIQAEPKQSDPPPDKPKPPSPPPPDDPEPPPPDEPDPPPPDEPKEPDPPKFLTFGPGTKIVGVDIQPGTYRTRVSDERCVWHRLSGFGGTFDELIQMDITEGFEVVTILSSDRGFDSGGCSTWTTDLSRVTASPTSPFSKGTFIVGVDVAPGLWRSEGDCYWHRLSGFTGTFDELIAIDNSELVQISSTDRGFNSSCNQWVKIQ